MFAFGWYILGDGFLYEFSPKEHPLNRQITENISISDDSLENVLTAADERAKYYRDDSSLASVNLKTDLDGNPQIVTCYFNVPYVDGNTPSGTIIIVVDIASKLIRSTNLEFAERITGIDPSIQIKNACNILSKMIDDAFQAESIFVKERGELETDVDFWIWPYRGCAEVVGLKKGATPMERVVIEYTLITKGAEYRLKQVEVQ